MSAGPAPAPTPVSPTPGPPLPAPRGPLSELLLTALRHPAPTGLPPAALTALTAGRTASLAAPDPPAVSDPWGEDVQLALYVCYELHYRGFAGVDEEWEWAPSLLALRKQLETAFLLALRRAVGRPPPLAEVVAGLLAEPVDGDGPSHHLLAAGTRPQAREYLVHRSLYHLKEADPQMWAVPRLPNPAKAALVAVQYDEYGAGRPERAHAELFADAMADFGLDPAYGAYLDVVPAPALAVVNTMSLFGLHRSLRAALVGQFAAVELTSSPGSARLAAAFERLGASPRGTLFHREHVLADAVHEQLVRRTVLAPLLAPAPPSRAAAPSHPEDDRRQARRPVGPDCSEAGIAFGALAHARTEDRLAAHLTAAWRAGTSSLRTPLPEERPR
ncbi:iron-containing redox enzyme family protein [Kitasatospora sp. NPDC088134]|uniref:iron-containing redox enzyme family protein n=1 Tax=Kitasatospora sp. NPDC088134 TaxID=3364071 RepID=UPI003804D4C0